MTDYVLRTGWADSLRVQLVASEDGNRWYGRAIDLDGKEVWNSGYPRGSQPAIRTAFNTWARHTYTPPQKPSTDAQMPEQPADEQQSSVGLVERLALLVASLDIQSMRISALIDKADMIFDRAERVLKELS